jgi:hypothetical protein
VRGTPISDENRPPSVIAAGPVSLHASTAGSAVADGSLADGMSRLPLRIAFFTSPTALVMRISRGRASVQLKIVRQRQNS